MPKPDAHELRKLLTSDEEREVRYGFKRLRGELQPEMRRHIKLAIPGSDHIAQRKDVLEKAMRLCVRCLPTIYEAEDPWTMARHVAFASVLCVLADEGYPIGEGT